MQMAPNDANTKNISCFHEFRIRIAHKPYCSRFSTRAASDLISTKRAQNLDFSAKTQFSAKNHGFRHPGIYSIFSKSDCTYRIYVWKGIQIHKERLTYASMVWSSDRTEMLEKNAGFPFRISLCTSSRKLKLCTHTTTRTRSIYFWFILEYNRLSWNQISDSTISRKCSKQAQNNTIGTFHMIYLIIWRNIVKTPAIRMIHPSKSNVRLDPLPAIHETERRKHTIRSHTHY